MQGAIVPGRAWSIGRDLRSFVRHLEPVLYHFLAMSMLTVLDDPAMLAPAFC